MKSLSIEDAFQWTQRFVAREWKLLLPLALAFLAVPQLAFNLLVPSGINAAFSKGDPQLVMQSFEKAPWVMPSALIVQLIALAGSLCITALAMVPRISVREAISLGLQRLPWLVAAVVFTFLAVTLAALLVATLLQFLPINPIGVKALLVLFMLGIALFLWIRLLVLGAVIVGTRAGPTAAIRLAWELSAGAFWRLLGCVLVYAIGAWVVTLASTFALGAIFILVCTAVGLPALGPVLSLTYAALASAVFWGGFHVLVVALYRQLGGSIRGA